MREAGRSAASVSYAATLPWSSIRSSSLLVSCFLLEADARSSRVGDTAVRRRRTSCGLRSPRCGTRKRGQRWRGGTDRLARPGPDRWRRTMESSWSGGQHLQWRAVRLHSTRHALCACPRPRSHVDGSARRAGVYSDWRRVTVRTRRRNVRRVARPMRGGRVRIQTRRLKSEVATEA